MKKMIGLGVVFLVVIVVAGYWYMKKSEKTEQQNIVSQGGSAVDRVKTASGLEYEIIKEGTGESPKAGQQVTVHYTGWLDNNGQLGTKFDSSVDRGTPFTFMVGVGQVIKGWDEGVMGMKVGEKRRLIIPASLGYGAQGAGRVIPPNATLIFDVELISIA
jgi:FKBP-type peptidyl-prolyl cis-trans isomerase